MSNEWQFQAYPKERHALETVMRMHSVKRWHMIDTTRIQTLAEHTANVTLLAYVIAAGALQVKGGTDIDCRNFFSPIDDLLFSALVHDLPEAFTGDVMTWTKRRAAAEIEGLEYEVMDPVFTPNVRPRQKLLVKLCDLADGIRFVRLHGVDMTAKHAQSGLEEQMSRKFENEVARADWPAEVVKHVRDNLVFYAYENS